MKRFAYLGMFVLAIVVAAIALGKPFLDRVHLAVLTPAQLALKPLSPPDDSCFQIQRTFSELPTKDPVRSSGPLGVDELAIYEAVLEHWNSRGELLNVSDKTTPLDGNTSDCECLKAVDVRSFADATRSYHQLKRDSFTSKNLRLVDAELQSAHVHDNDPHASMEKGLSVDAAVKRAFANGLFTVSEVAFDNERNRAIVSFSFVCGSLCGSGNVWLFEKVDGAWKKSEHTCGGWTS